MLLTKMVVVNANLGTKVQAASISQPMPIDQIFLDTKLAEQVKRSLGKKRVTDLVSQEELDEIQKFNCSGCGIQSIKGLEYFTNTCE